MITATENAGPAWTNPKSPEFLPYLQVPDAFFERAARFLSGLEQQLFLLIAKRTYGNKAAGYPEWLTDVPFTKFASICGASKNGVAIALERLERSGAIKSERLGRGKRYRCEVANLGNVVEVPLEVGKDAVASEDDETDAASVPTEKTDDVPMIRIGKHSVALSAVQFCKGCAEKVIAAVKTAMSPAAAEKANEPVQWDVQANNGRMIVPVSGTIAETKANEGRTIVPLQLDDPDLATLETHLSTNYAKKLGEPPPRRLTEPAVADLRASGVPIGDLIARIDARRSVFKYGLLGNLTADVINAHAAAHRSGNAAVDPTPLSPAEWIRAHAAARIAEIEAHAPDTPERARVIEALELVNANAATLAKNPYRLREILHDAETVLASCVWSDLTKDERARIDARRDQSQRTLRTLVTRHLRPLVLEEPA